MRDGNLTIVIKIPIGTNVRTLAWGNSTKYAPNTPATAPLAPITGIVEVGLKIKMN